MLSVLWLITYGGSDYLAAQHDYRVRLHFDFELTIPFWPQWTIGYLSLFPMLWLSPFVLPSEAKLKRFANSLGWLILISGIGFVLLPSTPAYTYTPTEMESDELFKLADRLNLNFNMLPSLHVGMAVLGAMTFSARKHWWIKLFFGSWSAAIAVSTLLLHQHHVLDVIAGAACAAGVFCAVNRCSSATTDGDSDALRRGDQLRNE